MMFWTTEDLVQTVVRIARDIVALSATMKVDPSRCATAQEVEENCNAFLDSAGPKVLYSLRDAPSTFSFRIQQALAE